MSLDGHFVPAWHGRMMMGNAGLAPTDINATSEPRVAYRTERRESKPHCWVLLTVR